ncbi:hypothetical protein [Aneurinibacillus tyrosinisolvens]|uniref:hypothetical protein n=1 Tax=Aneurinibacillus tyrosinisolvens TaxID=1443435 RepID=UPI00063F1594|nr:hypothetical protein [Aneurinibacillus tyrosinisolvens]
MWVGSFKWNLYFAGIMSIFTFVFSIANNLLLESLIRSLFAFVVCFFLMFGIRLAMGKMIGKENRELFSAGEKGQRIDLVTPDEPSGLSGPVGEKHMGTDDSGHEFEDFAPLELSKVVRKEAPDINPEEIAKALRVFSNE